VTDGGTGARDYFAVCGLGLEPAVAAELGALGVGDARAGRAGVTFTGTREQGYAANLWLRAAIRVQELVFTATVRGQRELYDRVREVDWRGVMNADQTLAVDASVSSSWTTHAPYAGQLVKDAICDQFRDRTGRRPSVERERPDVPLKLVLQRDRAVLYLNMSGASLHKRGYRAIEVKSPLNEATAAGLLILAEWDRKSSLVDPMCGSATFLVEAALMALDRAPGLRRRFPFERWATFDAATWLRLTLEAERRARKELPFPLLGSDRHGGALSLARRAIAAAGVERCIELAQADVAALTLPWRPATVVTNPPYGLRLGEGEDLERTWRELGAFLRRECAGATAFVLSGDPALTPLLGLKADRRFAVRNGPIDCRWLRYPLR
jgi:putative N6-adenine-specific DNA methylase